MATANKTVSAVKSITGDLGRGFVRTDRAMPGFRNVLASFVRQRKKANPDGFKKLVHKRSLIDMSNCLHTRIFFQHRMGDKYGQNIKASCACNRIETNWHTEKGHARIAFQQIQSDRCIL